METIKRRLNALEYPKHLTSDKWKRLRQAALTRARFQCELCSTMKSLAAHHVRYPKNGFRHDSVDNLIIVCERCHGLLHGIRPKAYEPGIPAPAMAPDIDCPIDYELAMGDARAQISLTKWRYERAKLLLPLRCAEKDGDKAKRREILEKIQNLKRDDE
jgi:hypothetical protein